METFEHVRSILQNVDLVVESFDNIFSDIAPIKAEEIRLASSCSIPRDLLSPEQCEGIKHLAGIIKEISDAAEMVRYRKGEDHSTVEEKLSNAEQTLAAKVKDSIRDQRIISTLQEYLVLELNRSEKLEEVLKTKESELVTVTAERNKFQSLCERQQPPPSRSQQMNPQKAEENDPSSLVGRFVRKKFDGDWFFGIVKSYEYPWFKVVYEDSDAEDLTLANLQRVVWRGSVPSAKEEQCRRHAETLVPEEDDDDEEESDDDGDSKEKVKEKGKSSQSISKKRKHQSTSSSSSSSGPSASKPRRTVSTSSTSSSTSSPTARSPPKPRGNKSPSIPLPNHILLKPNINNTKISTAAIKPKAEPSLNASPSPIALDSKGKNVTAHSVDGVSNLSSVGGGGGGGGKGGIRPLAVHSIEESDDSPYSSSSSSSSSDDSLVDLTNDASD